MDYKCTLCRGEFKDPRLLDCYHSFCRFCLDEYLMVSYDDGKFSCPLCKEYNSVPVNGARGLPKNKYIDCGNSNSKADCDLCQQKIKADSICRDCNQNLCKSCLVSHINLQGSRFHNVISLGTDRAKQAEACSVHKKQELLYYCDTCEIPICNTCNVTDHKSHRSKDIASMSTILRKELHTSLQQLTLNSDANDFQSKVTDQQRKIRAYQEDVISAIDERTKELHRLIDEVRGEFVRKVVNENADSIKQLESNQETLNTNVAAIQEILKFSRNFLEHAHNPDFVVHIPKIQKQIKKLQNTDIQIADIKQKIFYPAQKDMTNLEIQKIFGSFEKPNRRPKDIKSVAKLSDFRRSNSDGEQRTVSNNSRRSIEEVSNPRRSKRPFTCTNGIVTSISFLSDRSICVCLGNEGILEIFSQSGRRKNTEKFRHPIDDVVADEKGALYVSSNFEKKIFKVVNDSREIFAETRFCVRGLAFDDNESLIAGMTEKASFFDTQQDGYITEISKDNRIKRVVEDSRLRYPARIAVGHPHCILVSDWIQLCVVICNRDRILGTYAGSGDYTKEFIPRGICCLSNGDIVVVDVSSNTLHWLSSEGKLRRVVPVDNLVEPWSLAVDKDDTVWIGTKDGRVIPTELF